MQRSKILVVDDEESLRLVLATLLEQQGHEIRVAASAEQGLKMVTEFNPDFIFADVRMPGMSGIELTKRVRSSGFPATVIVMSAYGSVDLAREAMKAGAYDYIAKPFNQDDVLLVLHKAQEREALRRENQALRKAVEVEQQFSGLIGQSDTMQQLYRLIDKVAGYQTTVLVTGESGTGKELVARALHERSPRKKAAFVAINCGAIPENLLESELFGHRKGAFTDANSDKAGLFEEAHQGTLFLDEVGELPLSLQVKLLRVLQEGVLRRLGETRDRPVDVRVIAATVRHLEEEVKQNRFREDLFYRLNVLQLRTPPLRERKADIPVLIQHFISRHNVRLSTNTSGVSQAALKLMLDYPWPGNVRELENLIERAMVLAEGEQIQVEDLPERLHKSHDIRAQLLASDDVSIKKAVRVLEETLIKRALEKTDGNRTAASKMLEISHRALLYKIKEYGIE